MGELGALARAISSAIWAACAGYGRHVSQAVIDFRNERVELFESRILCMDCQRRTRKGQI